MEHAPGGGGIRAAAPAFDFERPASCSRPTAWLAGPGKIAQGQDRGVITVDGSPAKIANRIERVRYECAWPEMAIGSDKSQQPLVTELFACWIECVRHAVAEYDGEIPRVQFDRRLLERRAGKHAEHRPANIQAPYLVFGHE